MPLGDFEGCKSPEHIARWLAALEAGKKKLPRCSSITRAGRPCRHFVMRGLSVCYWHLPSGAARIELDRARIPRLERMSQLSDLGVKGRYEAVRGLKSIQRYQLLYGWRFDPTLTGTTLAVLPHDERRIRAWLLIHQGIDLDQPWEATGRPPSPRLTDKLRWAAYWALGERKSLQNIQTRIRQALKHEVDFFSRHKMEAVIE